MEELNLNNRTKGSIKNRLVKGTFYITYAFLLTTATITFIEAMRTKDPGVRHILNLETCISVVAAFFYTQFMKKMNDYKDKELNYKEINVTRYTDWLITTPIMLLVLCLVFGYNNKTTMTAAYFLIIMVLNFIMLAFGYVGEVGLLDRRLSQLGGFIFFFILYGTIYFTFLHNKYNFDNQIIFWAFVFFWFLYGIFYEMDEESKNAGYNVLDLFSKCFVGIFFWLYLTNSVKF